MDKKNSIKEINKRIKDIISQPGFSKTGKPVFHQGNDTGILIIHGFDDTPFIMNEYADFFKKEGFTIYNITLPGRGLTVQDFSKTTWQDWIDSAKIDYLLLKNITKKTFIAGFSTGATISLYITHILKKNELPDGLILMSPALFFINHLLSLSLGIILMQIYNILNPYPKKLNNRHLIYKDPIAREKYDILKKSSTKGIIELLKLARKIKHNIKVINPPCLTIQSKKDVVVDRYGAKWIIKKCVSPIKKLLKLYKSGHPVMVDLEKDKVFKESLKFINNVLANNY